MKIAACVVLYNPSSTYVENVLSYLDDVDRCFVIDNSENDFHLDTSLVDNPKIKYIKFGENKGIGYALKIASEEAIKEGFDYLLTMDQDSKLSPDAFDKFQKFISANDVRNIAQISLNTTEFKKDDDEKVKTKEVDMCITSGCFVDLKLYKKIGGFNEQLFIDLVDFDLSHQFIEAGYKIVVLLDAYIIHKIGEPIQLKRKILGKTIISSNHSPIRYYYIYRNELFLYKQDKSFFKNVHKNHKKDVWRMLLCEKQKRLKLKMIRRGKRDAKKGKLGKYSYN